MWVLGCDGEACEETFLDIEEEILPHQDHGLMSIALDPDFLENGFVYVLYVVDPHHLHMYGTPEYNPNETWTNNATIGRLTRYQALAEYDFSIVDPDTRTVLIGESIGTGIPIVNLHHGLGELHFSVDGSLCFSMGDSSSFVGADIGGQSVDGFVKEALDEGILTPNEDVGAFRAQLLDSMCGKMLRVNPATGDGLPSNPYFDKKSPRSARSRVWAIGIRNVFRWEFMPGTGSTDPSVGDPGVMVVSDVGWDAREETGLIPGPGVNLGWPLFEGFDNVDAYWFTDVENPIAPNPLAGDGCSEFFMFRDLIQEERPGGQLFSNPCDAAWIEAEDALHSGLTLDTDEAGSTGGGSLKFTSSQDEWIEFVVSGDDSGTVMFGLRYTHTSNSPRELNILVDGSPAGALALEESPCSYCWVVHEFELALEIGTRTVRLVNTSASGLRVDSLEVSNRSYSEIPPDILTFVHQRPLVDWYQTSDAYARVAATRMECRSGSGFVIRIAPSRARVFVASVLQVSR